MSIAFNSFSLYSKGMKNVGDMVDLMLNIAYPLENLVIVTCDLCSVTLFVPQQHNSKCQ